jgi:hypothetical protein
MMRYRYRGQILALVFNTIAALAIVAPIPVHGDDEGVRVMARCGGSGAAASQVSLAAALTRSSRLDAILLAPAEADIVEEAARTSCELAVDVSSETLPSGEARSSWRILDTLTGAVLAQGVVEGPEPSDRDLADFWWIPVVDAAEAALPKVTRTLVRIDGYPGTVITGQAGKQRGGLAEGPLVIPDTGSLEIPLRIPGTYPWRATSAGAYPERGYFGALEQGASMIIPRRPIRPWTLEAGLYMGQFPDFWAMRSLGNDQWFLRFGLTQFLFGLYLVDEHYLVQTLSAVLSMPLVQPGVGVGGYLLPKDAYLRPYWSTDVFARLLLLHDLSPRLDTIAPMGTGAALGTEWSITERATVFLELGAALYPFCDGFLMAASRSGYDGGPMAIVYGTVWLLELPVLRAGARFTL